MGIGLLAAASLGACSSGSGSTSATAAASAPSVASSAAGGVSGSSAAPVASASGSATATASCSPSATKLTMWGWAAGYDLAVAAFNKSHPDICVVLENNGASTAEYVKIGDAVKAGSGAPDVAEVEYFDLPSLEITHSLVDLTQYGVSAYKATTAPVAWAQASQGSAVYAMPVDLGPLAQYYNSALFAKYHLSPATTWTAFAADAATLHAANPKAAIANFDPESAQDVLALMQEFNAFPFSYTGGSTLGIHFTGASEMAFATYWQQLLASKEATKVADFSPGQWSNLDTGVDAVRFSPAWGPVGMQLTTKATLGNWRAAAMPQTQAGQQLSGNWGGSTVAVLAQGKHAKQAAEFAEWFGGTAASWQILSGPVAGAFPGYTPLLNSAAFQARTLPISGSSHPNAVFAAAAEHEVNPQWPPIMTAALTQWTTSFAGVVNGTETLPQAFTSYQKAVVAYATSQGFTVTQ